MSEDQITLTFSISDELMHDFINHLASKAEKPSNGSSDDKADRIADIENYAELYMIAATGHPKFSFVFGMTNAFMDCNFIHTVIIPEGVEKIADGMFYNCRNIKNIHLPNSIVSIGTKAFYGCRCLTEIQLPEHLVSIEEYAFNG
jgi:hypothetical protein